MTKHIWRWLKCKNPQCGCANLLQYYGVYEGQTAGGDEFTTGFSWNCGDCGKLFRYELEETQVGLFDQASPPGWKSPFGPSVGQLKSTDRTKLQ
jgi:hypothetical protein